MGVLCPRRPSDARLGRHLATIELHPFFLRVEEPAAPTAVIFGLDPGAPADIVDCSRAALLLRRTLADCGLDAFAKTSGSVGLHVVVPLNARHSWPEAKVFCARGRATSGGRGARAGGGPAIACSPPREGAYRLAPE
jgi:DNA primase